MDSFVRFMYGEYVVVVSMTSCKKNDRTKITFLFIA